MKPSFALTLVMLLAAVASVVAQTPKATTSTDTSATSTTTANDVQKTLEEIIEEPTTTDTYRYDPQGRRDPFRSLIGPAPKLEPGQRPAGVAGFLIDEMKLQGIFRTKAGLTAMISGPDNKGYLLHVGEKV
ncbi:MAG TPA: hypothetical protein VJZ00_04215, partial [Thermoanaerobaculia bacterium]|nr:hypothetical protein [Thermoanaerobaculia bacterium]